MFLDLLKALELGIQLVMPGKENGSLEDECGAADDETGDGQVALEERLDHNSTQLVIITINQILTPAESHHSSQTLIPTLLLLNF
jgi:hypothetical protein